MAETKQGVIDYIAATPLAEMGDVLTALADKVYTHRLDNRGYVPIQVFEQLLGPVTVSVQIVHSVFEHGKGEVGYAMRLREGDEAGLAYQGKYHNTCTSLRWGDTLKSAILRNDKDAFDNLEEGKGLVGLGVTYHHEAPRRNMDLTFMFLRHVWSDDLPKLHGTWKVFTLQELKEMIGKPSEELPIVESNLHQLLWVMDSNRRPFGVLKETFPKQLKG